MKSPLPLLKVKNLKVHFPIRTGVFQRITGWIKAVDDVSFSIPRGTTTGLVGESGSGKTTIGRAIIKLHPITSGEILYENTPIHTLPEKAFRNYRKKIQMIFQDPFNSLNPRLTVLDIVGEAIEIHFPQLNKSDRIERVAALLEKVGLQKDHLHRYPHEFSGGQRQRIGIARALAVEPEFIICDEPVSALDVSVQAQILNLLQDLQDELHLTYLFIAHDLAIVEHMSDQLLIMQQGKIVEAGSAEQIYQSPQHPYTQELIASIPKFQL
jgi:peptide/nickel transport system ATP-binding protein/oligopeptide transport system ATP-binding protein